MHRRTLLLQLRQQQNLWRLFVAGSHLTLALLHNQQPARNKIFISLTLGGQIIF